MRSRNLHRLRSRQVKVFNQQFSPFIQVSLKNATVFQEAIEIHPTVSRQRAERKSTLVFGDHPETAGDEWKFQRRSGSENS